VIVEVQERAGFHRALHLALMATVGSTPKPYDWPGLQDAGNQTVDTPRSSLWAHLRKPRERLVRPGVSTMLYAAKFPRQNNSQQQVSGIIELSYHRRDVLPFVILIRANAGLP
jgi:hypothetical protein